MAETESSPDSRDSQAAGGTSEHNGLLDLATTLSVMSTGVQAVCLREASRLEAALRQQKALPEFVLVLMLDQVASACSAIAALALGRQQAPLTLAAYTALGRLPVEGVIYLNLILSRQNQDEAARLYLCGDIAFREDYLAEKSNRSWHRRHGKPKHPANRGPRLPYGKPAIHVRPYETAMLDHAEMEWLWRGCEAVLSETGSIGGVAAKALPARNAPLWTIRVSWNHLSDRLGDAARMRWVEHNEQWNLLPAWPMGLKPHQARDLGGFYSRVDAFIEEDPPDLPLPMDEVKEMWKYWLSDVGMEFMSVLTHASPTRVHMTSSAFEGTTLALAAASMLLATRLLPDSYTWTIDARAACEAAVSGRTPMTPGTQRETT